MANVVFDASSIVGALLKQDSVPERALLLARPRFARHLGEGRGARILDLIASAAARFAPGVAVQDCRDAKDNKYLELALAAGAASIVSSDADLLVLDPWRGVRILTPAQYLRQAG